MSPSCIRVSHHCARDAPGKRLHLLRQLLSSYIRHSDERFEYGSVEYASLATLFLGTDEVRPAQPELRCNPTLPARKLSYDEDTVLTLPSDYTKAAPLPDGTHVRFVARGDGQKQPVASIPSEWLLALPTDAFLLHDALGHPCQVRFDYKLSGVQRDTAVGMIEADVAEFLRGQLKGLPRKPHLVYRTVTAEGSFAYETVDPDATAQHEDLFCRSREIIVTNVPLTQLPRDALQQQRAFASQGAGNTRPAAPEHNRMLNNLIGEDHSKHKEGTRLPTSAADWRKLRNHLNAIEGQPQCVCHNCGMLIYRKDATFLAKVSSRDELRAWRVFRPLIEEHAGRTGVPVDDIFLCEQASPAPDDGAARCRVFACGSCRSEKARDPAQYDLMDGVQADGTLEDIGLGSALPPVLAVLTTEERLALSVVKVSYHLARPMHHSNPSPTDSTSRTPPLPLLLQQVIDGAYEDYSKRKASGAYSRYWGGAFLEPGDLGRLSSAYRGMSALLVRDATDVQVSNMQP